MTDPARDLVMKTAHAAGELQDDLEELLLREQLAPRDLAPMVARARELLWQLQDATEAKVGRR